MPTDIMGFPVFCPNDGMSRIQLFSDKLKKRNAFSIAGLIGLSHTPGTGVLIFLIVVGVGRAFDRS